MPISQHLLEQFPLLQPLPKPVKESLCAQMNLLSYAKRAMVLSKDGATQALGFLVEGRLQGVDFTVDGRNVGLYFVEPGDYFGELSVVDREPPSEFVVAAMKSVVAVLDARIARDLIYTQPALASTVMARLASRVRTAMEQRKLLSLQNPFQRLCVLLLQLHRQNTAAPSATPVTGGVPMDNAPTHQELAIMINASRETVTRAFQVLFFHKVFLRDGTSLRLIRADVLKEIAEGKLDITKGELPPA